MSTFNGVLTHTRDAVAAKVRVADIVETVALVKYRAFTTLIGAVLIKCIAPIDLTGAQVGIQLIFAEFRYALASSRDLNTILHALPLGCCALVIHILASCWLDGSVLADANVAVATQSRIADNTWIGRVALVMRRAGAAKCLAVGVDFAALICFDFANARIWILLVCAQVRDALAHPWDRDTVPFFDTLPALRVASIVDARRRRLDLADTSVLEVAELGQARERWKTVLLLDTLALLLLAEGRLLARLGLDFAHATVSFGAQINTLDRSVGRGLAGAFFS